MNASSGLPSWTATQVRALAATGLASSHLQPFVRLLYNDPKTRVNGSKSILVESGNTADDVVCSRQRERNGRYTASCNSQAQLRQSEGGGQIFNVHTAVDWAELQLWNRFDNGFDVFLGKASVSLHQLQHQCDVTTTSGGTDRSSVTTGPLWFPLQTSEVNGLTPHLSLQMECTFTSDPKVLRIREEIKRRRKRTTFQKNKHSNSNNDESDQENDASESDSNVDGNDPISIPDPAFAFTQPFLSVDWSLIASTSTRHLFFHVSTRNCQSSGGRELDEDEGLQIHDDHLTAFKMCQFAAQYLDNCVGTLSQRLEDYSDDYRVLADTRSRLKRDNRSLRKRLQKEHDDLDLLISTYQRVLEKNQGVEVAQIQQQQPISPVRNSAQLDSSPARAPISPTPSFSSKKPVFLNRSWEERERERRLEKEISKAQRIEEEKQRLLQRVLERQQRDDYESFLSKFAENRRRQAARKIQTFFRSIKSALHAKRCAAEYRAVSLVQAAWKRYMHMRDYPRRLENRREEMEILRMEQNEKELRLWLAEMEQRQCEEGGVARAMSPPESIHSNEPEDGITGIPSPSVSPPKQVVDTLVAIWRKLHRVFVVAHRTKGTDYQDLFDEIDLRKDDVLDRAELRLGARSFGVRLDRKITRAYFMQGFELIQTKVEQDDTKLTSDIGLEGVTNASVIECEPLHSATETPVNRPDENEGIDEEALVVSVRAFRAAVYESASKFLESLGKPSNDYRAFRDTLALIFAEFDADRNGELDVGELVACMSSFNLRLSDDNVSLLRELFVGDREHCNVGVAEFISFVLAHSASSSEEDELGLLGYRLREGIMLRVQQARTEKDSVEDAVRRVFEPAYKRKTQRFCAIREFARVLNRLQLGVTPTQIARFVVRLDRDGDRSISFEELLVWLRIRSKTSLDIDSGVDSGGMAASHAALQFATSKAKALRLLLKKLASGENTLMSPESKTAGLKALFYRIDNNNSGKINQEELQVFLESQDLSTIVSEEVLSGLYGLSIPVEPSAALIAQEMMALLDMNANGVTTLSEWLTFAQHDGADGGDDPVVVEALRRALKESEDNDLDHLLTWFHSLPGAIHVASARPGEPAQIKVRVAEFKTALRAKLGGARSVPLHAVDRVVENLDKDRSGWITTGELCAWAFPVRDLEEILRLVVKSWQDERFQASSYTQFAGNLYTRFDTDGNGSLAVRELLSGLAFFGVVLTEYEARVLLIAFDVDGDGCWSKTEFVAFVDKLFPAESLVEKPAPDEHAATEVQPSTKQVSKQNGSSNGSDDNAYSDDDLLLHSESSNALSSLSDEEQVSARPVEYSEDFFEDD
ncbi:unnamed protein product [Phytophthora fragariaefolia]|uniref:Unnamed protein product n=1 Tax=Phytophthora fragariaefolia TaxID=1490495 RepID=A0A9W7D6Z5_9STRA|nr:unnamed protein product [Phytophthora fragariaefolia]